jgi:geranylgeranyl diphosphate synthase type II
MLCKSQNFSNIIDMSSASADFTKYLTTMAGRVDKALHRFLPAEKIAPQTIHKAMRYSVFAGGKRLRPILCIAAAEACGGDAERAMPAACAVEVLHTYSLVHDDLPCMDDDDLRRGRPTCHKVFGDGMAVLCGDALLTEAFYILAETQATPRYRSDVFIKELALTSGSRHLIGGQVMDLEGEGKSLNKAQLVLIHKAKTAALLTTSLRLGAMAVNATPAKLAALTTFGQALGLAFQIIDDILDVTQSTEVLGKTAGKDANVDKATYPAIVGLEKSRKEAAALTKKAMYALTVFGKKAGHLHQLADFLLARNY